MTTPLVSVVVPTKDVERTVGRSVGREPAPRLLQLALAPDPISTSGLVPGHGDVDEPLEEIPLVGLRRPPGLLEELVGGEVLAVRDLVEAELVRAFDVRSIVLQGCRNASRPPGSSHAPGSFPDGGTVVGSCAWQRSMLPASISSSAASLMRHWARATALSRQRASIHRIS